MHSVGRTDERAALDALEGLIPNDVGARLYDLAADVPAELAIVELGSYRGKSTCYLGAGARSGHGAHVFAVDPWNTAGNRTGRFGFADPQTFAAFNMQVATMDLRASVTALRGFSTDVARHWTKPIGLLYVDGSHTYEDVLADVRAWGRFLVPGGVIAFDDYRTERNPGVARVVDAMKAGTDWDDWTDGPPPLTTGRRRV